MAHLNTSLSPDNGNENIHASNTYIRSKARVFFVRHGKSVEDTGGLDSNPQSKNAELNDIGKEQIKNVTTYLSHAGIGDRNDIVLYGDDTLRVCESVRIITEGVISETNLREKLTPKLRTTKKGLQGVKRIKENTTVFRDTIVLMEQIRRWVNIHIKGNAVGIILVGHKSNKSGSEQAADNINEAIDISFDIENGGIIERDIDANTGEYIDPRQHPETLFLNRENYKKILKSLEDIPELNELIMKFRENTQIDSGKYPIWELQNDVNVYFQKQPECFSRFLNDKNSPIHLRFFCLTNLIIQKDYDVIENYYLSSECTSLSNEEKMIFLRNIEKPEVMKIFRILFVSKGKLWENVDQIFISKYLGSVEYNKMKVDQGKYQKILEFSNNRARIIFENSIDTTIKIGEGLIPRGLYTFQKQSEKAILKIKESGQGNISKENEYKKNTIDLEAILQSSITTHILLGHVGDGKSTELARMKLEIDIHPKYNEYIGLFYSAKENGINPIETINQEIEFLHNTSPEKKIIIFFDGIDELTIGVRENLVNFLRNLNSNNTTTKIRSIIGSRPSGFDVYEDGAINFNALSSEEIAKFNRSRLKNLGKENNHNGFWVSKKVSEIMDFLEKDILDKSLKNTPLILFFLCKLCIGDELSSIENRIDLYEKIITLILSEHQGNRDGKKSELMASNKKLLFDTLGYCAYKKATHPKQLLQPEDILIYLQNEQLIDSEIIKNNILDQIFLLYKLQGGGYEFIHKSFEEYFIYHYRSGFFEKNNPLQKTWNTTLQVNKNEGLTLMLTSTANMSFEAFEEDTMRILDQGGDIPLIKILQSIVDIGNQKAYKLLEKISTLDLLNGDPEMIINFCNTVGILWENYEPLGGNDARGYSLLERIINTSTFSEYANYNVMQVYLYTLYRIRYFDCINILNKALLLDSSNTHSHLMSILCIIASEFNIGSISFLKQIMNIPTFREDIYPWKMEAFCKMIGNIKNSEEKYCLMREVLVMDTFTGNIDAIKTFIHSVMSIDNREILLSFIMKIMELPIFNEDTETIIDSIFVRFSMDTEEGLTYLFLAEKLLLDLNLVQNSSPYISVICSCQNIEWPKKECTIYYKLLKKLMKMPGYQKNSEAIESICLGIKRNCMNDIDGNYYEFIERIIETDSIYQNALAMKLIIDIIRIKNNKILLKKLLAVIPVRYISNPEYFIIHNWQESIANTCSYYNIYDKAILHLDYLLELTQIHQPENLNGTMEDIINNPDWEGMRKHPDFITIIGKYYIAARTIKNLNIR